MHHRASILHHRHLLIRARAPQRQNIALMPIRIFRRLLSGAQARRRSLGAITRIRVDVNHTSRDILPEDGAVEDPVGGFGLVGRDFVAGLENAGEGEVAVLADETAGVGGVGDDGGVAGGGVGGFLGVGDCERCRLAAEPCGFMM